MAEKNKKRDPMPSTDATPEEIGEFWDTHCLIDYLDETHEVEFEVNLRSGKNQSKHEFETVKHDTILSDESDPDIPVTMCDVAGNVLNFFNNIITTIDLPASTIKNIYKTVDRLSSAAVDIPNANLEGVSAEKRAVSEARVRQIKEYADKISKQMRVSQEYVPQEYFQRAGNKYAEKIIGEQINLDRITSLALNELQKHDTDKTNDQVTIDFDINKPNTGTDQDTNDREEYIIDDIWLNIFEAEARPRSTKEAQLIFGRILAGEIQNPGSYSIKTIKTLGEMDRNTAALFKKLCSVGIVLENPINKEFIDFRVPSLGGKAGSNALKKYGLPFNKLNILNEFGLIIPNYHSGVDYQVSIIDDNNRVLAPFQHQGQYWALRTKSEQKNIDEFRIWGLALTRVGRELMYVVDIDTMPEYTEDLKKFFASQHLQMVEVPSPILKTTKTN